MPNRRIATLRDESRRLIAASRLATEPSERERLALRALELAQEAEELERRDREQRGA